MKRKLLATILCASMALATLAGCGGNTQTASTDAPAAETKTEEAAPAATDEAAPATTESNLEGALIQKTVTKKEVFMIVEDRGDEVVMRARL